MKSQPIPFEVPWLAVYSAEKNALALNDKQGYSTWLPTRFVDGQRVMIIPLSLAADDPHFHAAAYRYWRGCVLPIIAEEVGEPNLDIAHDVVVAQLTGVQAAPKKRKGLKLKRKSTAMDSMPCAELCDLIDRAIVWATHGSRRDHPDGGPGVEVEATAGRRMKLDASHSESHGRSTRPPRARSG